MSLVVTIRQTSIAGGPILGLGGSFCVAAKTFNVFDSRDFEAWSTNQCFLSAGPSSWSAPCGPPGGGYLGLGPVSVPASPGDRRTLAFSKTPARTVKMNNINPFIAVPATLLILAATFVWWSRRTKAETKSKRAADFVFLWPLVLQGRRTSREKLFILVGAVVGVALICWSFTLPKP